MRKNTRARTTSVKWNINRNIWSVNLNSCLNFTFLIVPRKTWMKNKHSQSSWRIIIPNTKVTHFEKKKKKSSMMNYQLFTEICVLRQYIYSSLSTYRDITPVLIHSCVQFPFVVRVYIYITRTEFYKIQQLR